jgi:hypothetical protein
MTDTERNSRPGLPDFSWYNVPKREKYVYQNGKNMYTKTGKLDQKAIKYTKRPQNIPNGHKIY